MRTENFRSWDRLKILLFTVTHTVPLLSLPYVIKHGYHYYIQLQNEFLHFFENTCCLSSVAYSVTTCWFYWALLWCVIIMILAISKSQSHISMHHHKLSLCYQFKSRYNKLALLALIRLHVLNRWGVASAAKVLSEPGGEVYSWA